jgi:hypothetical protein
VRNLLANDAVRPNCCACYYSTSFVVFGALVRPVQRSVFFCRTYSLVMRVIREKHVNVLVVCNEPCVIGPLSLVRLIGHSACPGIGEDHGVGPAALAALRLTPATGLRAWAVRGPARPGAGGAGAGGARVSGVPGGTAIPAPAGSRRGEVVSRFGHSGALMAQVPHSGRHFVPFCPVSCEGLAPYVAIGYRWVRMSPARSEVVGAACLTRGRRESAAAPGAGARPAMA